MVDPVEYPKRGEEAVPDAPAQAPQGLTTAFSPATGGVDPREHLSKLQGLFVLSQLMAESRDQDHILRLAGSSVPSLGPFRLVGIHLRDSGWSSQAGARGTPRARADIETQLAKLMGGGGPLVVRGHGWAWAFSLRTVEGPVGHLTVACDSEPSAWAHFLLGVLTQQTAIALANARLYARQRAQATELQMANAALATTISALERGTAIHERLTQVAVAGEGEEGIAHALHELTGWPVAIEDRHGNLRAWSGPGRPDPYPRQSPPVREKLVHKALDAGRPIHEANGLLTVASPRADVLGVIVLVDVPRGEAERAQVALEHAATVLAMELARLQSVAETELRLGRDLVEELLANTDERAALSRAHALGYDLRRPHRVAIVVEDPPRRRDPDSRFHAVRRAARDAALGTLLVPRGDAIVVLAQAERVWDIFHRRLLSELSADVWVAVGGPSEDLGDFPRSYHEARLALRMRNTDGTGQRTLFYEKLGTYRLLAEVGELGVIDRFVEEWIGTLIAYDSDHRAELVGTLSSYLECGGSYDATATKLSVHRNTLKYRLRRIREISGRDLKDPDTLFNLQLATRAWITRQALKSREDVIAGTEATSPRSDPS
jgi:sugar diacid utilization regulator